MNSLIYILIGILAGFLLGAGISVFIFTRHNKKNAVGTLQIIESEGEKPYLFLSLDTDIKYFAHEPTVLMNVTHKLASHK